MVVRFLVLHRLNQQQAINLFVPFDISIQNQVCNLSQTNLKNEYQLYDLLQNGNIDGRIFMNAYILKIHTRIITPAILVQR